MEAGDVDSVAESKRERIFYRSAELARQRFHKSTPAPSSSERASERASKRASVAPWAAVFLRVLFDISHARNAMPAEISAAAYRQLQKAPLPHYNPNANANVKQSVFMGFFREPCDGGREGGKYNIISSPRSAPPTLLVIRLSSGRWRS